MLINSLKTRSYLEADFRSAVTFLLIIFFNMVLHFCFYKIIHLDTTRSQMNPVHTLTLLCEIFLN